MNEKQPSQGRAPQVRKAGGGISLHIDRLVIEGVPMSVGQAAKLRTAVQQELMDLLQRDGLERAGPGGAVPALSAPAIAMSLPFHPAEAGREIARSVYGALTGRV